MNECDRLLALLADIAATREAEMEAAVGNACATAEEVPLPLPAPSCAHDNPCVSRQNRRIVRLAPGERAEQPGAPH